MAASKRQAEGSVMASMAGCFFNTSSRGVGDEVDEDRADREPMKLGF